MRIDGTAPPGVRQTRRTRDQEHPIYRLQRILNGLPASSAGAVLVILAASAFSCAPDPAPGSNDESDADSKAGDTVQPMAAEPLARVPIELDYEAHAEALRAEWGDGFTVIVEKPFVVVGDEIPVRVKQHAEGTVRWAVEKLKAEYFEHDPDHIITVYLFAGKASYEKHAERLSGRPPRSPFGYYSPSKRMMVMNISTGGGTLVHEIVHPYVAANFPACPAWFNEALGSLYEQSGSRDGRIVGKTNWRLRGLQKAIKTNSLPTFEQLTATTTREFYAEGSGLRYAQARYLAYFLQEQGKLHEYYHAFHANHEQDPTGYNTLREVLGGEGEDMARFQRDWEQWVMKLRYP